MTEPRVTSQTGSEMWPAAERGGRGTLHGGKGVRGSEGDTEFSPSHTRTVTLDLSRVYPVELYVWTQMSALFSTDFTLPAS